METAVYRAPDLIDDDGNQERFNRSEDPFGFPSDHFAMHRWRGEVTPFWIEVRGQYVVPENSPVELPARPGIRDVEIFTGAFASLQQDLDHTLAQDPK